MLAPLIRRKLQRFPAQFSVGDQTRCGSAYTRGPWAEQAADLDDLVFWTALKTGPLVVLYTVRPTN